MQLFTFLRDSHPALPPTPTAYASPARPCPLSVSGNRARVE